MFDLNTMAFVCCSYTNEGKVTIRSRNCIDITRRYLEIVAAANAAYPTGSRVFDREIVVYNPDVKRFDFGLALVGDAQSRLGKIAHLSRTLPATYVAFDVLWRDGSALRGRPLRARLRR